MVIMEAYNLTNAPPLTEEDYTPHYDEDDIDYLIYDDGYIEQEPRWTRKRVVMFIIAIVVIIAMIVVLIAPLLQSMVVPVPSYIPLPATPPSQL